MRLAQYPVRLWLSYHIHPEIIPKFCRKEIGEILRTLCECKNVELVEESIIAEVESI